MEYVVKDHEGGDRKYYLSYSELKDKYHEFVNMSDTDFLKNLPEAAHFACIVSWVKQLCNDATIGDCGIVHELIHLMTNSPFNEYHFKLVRNQFNTLLLLS